MSLVLTCSRSMSTNSCGELARNVEFNRLQARLFLAFDDQDFGRILQSLIADIANVFDFHLKAAGVPQAVDRRRNERKDDRLVNLIQLMLQTLHDRVLAQVRASFDLPRARRSPRRSQRWIRHCR